MKTIAFVLVLGTLGAACGDSQSPTTPSTATVASPTTTETFSGTLQVGGASFYSFVVAVNGTVNVTLASDSGPDGASAVTLGLAIGTPSGTSCSGGSVTNALPGTDPQVTSTYSPGRYCVNVSDVGSLVGPTAFNVTIAHP
jgi:hypothetical protein